MDNGAKWSSFAILDNMNNLRKKGVLCDLTLIMKNRRFPCDREVLIAVSRYIEEIFKKDGLVNEIVLPDFDENIFEAFLEYAYTGLINLRMDSVSNVLQIAHTLLVDSLTSECTTYMSRNIDAACVVKMHDMCEKLGYVLLAGVMKSFINENRNDVLKESNCDTLSPEIMLKMVTKVDHQLVNEHRLFNAIMSWIEYNKEERLQYKLTLLKSVCFEYLDLKTITEAIKEAEYVEDYLKGEYGSVSNLTFDMIYFITTGNSMYNQSGFRYNGRKWYKMYEMDEASLDVGAVVDMKMTILNKALYMYCNSRDKGDYKFRHFDLEKEVWTPLRMPSTEFTACYMVSNHQADRLYLNGDDYIDTGNMVLSEYHPSINRWTNVKCRNNTVTSACLICCDNVVLLCGGDEGSYATDIARIYDPRVDKCIPISRMKHKRTQLAGVFFEGKVYVTGGIGIRDIYLHSGEVYDLAAGKWKLIDPMYNERSSHFMVPFENQLWIFDYGAQKSKLEMYLPRQEMWSRKWVDINWYCRTTLTACLG